MLVLLPPPEAGHEAPLGVQAVPLVARTGGRLTDELARTLLEQIGRLTVAIDELKEVTCRQNDATDELARRKKLHAESEKRSRAKRASQNDATAPKPAESLGSQNPACGHSDTTPQVVKAVAFVEDQDQLRKEKRSQRGVTLTPRPEPNGATGPLWQAYSAAYSRRYGAEPVRNAKVNGQLSGVIKRLGAEEAPDVAAFYVAHKAAFYAQKGHPVGLLLLDAEKLRTEWITGRQITSTAARQQERTAANGQVWDSLLKGEKHGVG
jgi:hypothetical protein